MCRRSRRCKPHRLPWSGNEGVEGLTENMINVTEIAANQIRTLLTKQQLPEGGLRVGVKAGGCSGFEYMFAWEAAPKTDDLVFSGPNGVRVWIDPRSHRLLDGTTLDYDTT